MQGLCRLAYLPTIVFALLAAVPAKSVDAFELFSTDHSYLGPGRFIGPGVRTTENPLFETTIRGMIFVSPQDFVTTFRNNGAAVPNNCSRRPAEAPPNGRLSNGAAVNENIDTCAMTIDGTRLYTAAVRGGPYYGEQRAVTLEDGNIVVALDFALDLGIGEKGVIRLPFYGTTGATTVPLSLQTQQGGKGIDQAGKYRSGTVITGRIGDFNEDGWIDGTIVSAGAMPLESPLYPGQPYVIIRNFETTIPIDGLIAGDIERISNGREAR